jgi:hypothetical protein
VTTFCLTTTYPSDVLIQGYLGGAQKLRLELISGPIAPAVPPEDAVFLDRCRAALAQTPQAQRYRDAVAKIDPATRLLDKLSSEVVEVQATREKLVTAPGTPDEKAMKKLADADRRLADLRSRREDAQRALSVYTQAAVAAREDVRAVLATIGRQQLDAVRRDIGKAWERALHDATSALQAPLARLLVAEAARVYFSPDSVHASSAAGLLRELPAIPGEPSPTTPPAPEPQAVASPDVEDEDDDPDAVLPLATAG